MDSKSEKEKKKNYYAFAWILLQTIGLKKQSVIEKATIV